MKERVIFIDLLRITSIIAVVILHVSAVRWYSIDVTSKNWLILNIYDSAVRWCVPIFIMISGVFFLNLDKQINYKRLYGKYILRIVLVLIITSFFYYFFMGVIEGNEINIEFIKNTVLLFLQGEVRYHLWFMYVIIGLYILTPILRGFIKGSEKGDIEYFILIGIILCSLVPLLSNFNSLNRVLAFVDKFNIPIGYFIYFISGYYFFYYDIKGIKKIIIYLAGIISFIFTVISTLCLSIIRGYPQTIFYEYLTLNVMFMSFSVFLFFKQYVSKIKIKKKLKNKIVLLSNLSFTIYLIHDAIMTLVLKSGLEGLLDRPVSGVLVLSVLIYLISLLIALVIKKIYEILKILI